MNKQSVRYRVTNWHDYNQALVRRGDLQLWFNDDVLATWMATKRTGRPGRPPTYSDVAVQWKGVHRGRS